MNIAASDLTTYLDHVERGIPPTETDEQTAEALTISGVSDALRAAAAVTKRKRIVILLDDAALTLTPEFLVEFFDIVRVLKASDISPKASVYPGTTEYGPRFHADHEGRSVPVWLSVNDNNYMQIMRDIARNRYPEANSIGEPEHQALMYAAFGVPRAYLTMLRQWKTSPKTTEQAKLNRIIQEHRDARVAEYRSLALKLPKLATVINVGEELLISMIEALRDANYDDPRSRQLLIAIPLSNFVPMTRRMVNLLVEAGLIREEPEISHGPDRKYIRLGPHVGALLAARAFSLGRGGGARRITEAMARPLAKHPVRRALNKLVPPETLMGLRLDLPPCQACGTERLSDEQRFCHSCGKKLLSDSVYSRCMKLPFADVPGLTSRMRQKIVEQGFNSIGDLMGVQDPGTELRKIWQVGELRSRDALAKIDLYIDEFLS